MKFLMQVVCWCRFYPRLIIICVCHFISDIAKYPECGKAMLKKMKSELKTLEPQFAAAAKVVSGIQFLHRKEKPYLSLRKVRCFLVSIVKYLDQGMIDEEVSNFLEIGRTTGSLSRFATHSRCAVDIIT